LPALVQSVMTSADRYAVGLEQARRHYEEAVKLYELAVRLGEREFEGRYNL
jgi:TPR repeat protein